MRTHNTHIHTHVHTTHTQPPQANEVFAGRIAMMGFMIAALRNFYDGAGPLAQVRLTLRAVCVPLTRF